MARIKFRDWTPRTNISEAAEREERGKQALREAVEHIDDGGDDE